MVKESVFQTEYASSILVIGSQLFNNNNKGRNWLGYVESVEAVGKHTTAATHAQEKEK
jgi:hypothetical protein